MHNESKQWTHVDRLDTGLHPVLYQDACFYYLRRTSEGWSVPSNQRIINFKHDPKEYKNNPTVWSYKLEEIEAFAQDISSWLNSYFMSEVIKASGNVALVPMPTSKPRVHPDFDSRLVDLCSRVCQLDGRVRLENILDVKEELKPSHHGGSRSVDYLINELMVYKPSQPLDVVILVDDLLTTGNHYAACSTALKQCFPDIATIGLFLARQTYI